MYKQTALSLVIAGIALVGSPLAHAADTWQFEVTPYLLGAGMSGTAGVHGMTTDVDLSFSDLVENLDSGLMGIVSARRGRLVLSFEGVYMSLEGNSTAVKNPGGAVSVSGNLDWSNTINIYQASIGYRVAEEKTLVDVFGALRRTTLDLAATVTTQFTPGVVFPGGSLGSGGSESWVDPAIGVLVQHPLGKTVSLVGYADMGSGESDLSWQAIAGLNWAYADRYTAKFGYRMVDWDYEAHGNTWDMSASGPYAGLGIKF